MGRVAGSVPALMNPQVGVPMFSSTIMSDRTGRLFLFSTWWTLAASILIGSLLIFPSALESSGSELHLAFSVLLAIVGLIASATSLTLLIGMLSHLTRMLEFRVVAKIGWGAVIVLGLPLGAVLYFFFVYQRWGASTKT